MAINVVHSLWHVHTWRYLRFTGTLTANITSWQLGWRRTYSLTAKPHVCIKPFQYIIDHCTLNCVRGINFSRVKHRLMLFSHFNIFRSIAEVHDHSTRLSPSFLPYFSISIHSKSLCRSMNRGQPWSLSLIINCKFSYWDAPPKLITLMNESWLRKCINYLCMHLGITLTPPFVRTTLCDYVKNTFLKWEKIHSPQKLSETAGHETVYTSPWNLFNYHSTPMLLAQAEYIVSQTTGISHRTLSELLGKNKGRWRSQYSTSRRDT